MLPKGGNWDEGLENQGHSPSVRVTCEPPGPRPASRKGPRILAGSFTSSHTGGTQASALGLWALLIHLIIRIISIRLLNFLIRK